MGGSIARGPVQRAWHRVALLRPELRTGGQSLAYFAADLDEVVRGADARPMYADPAQFFALTYPTFALRKLARDVAHRLDGADTGAVHRLNVTYGGGKTHTLVTLLHLFREGTNLPPIAAVSEIRQHAGVRLAPSRVAALAFDKLDVTTGMLARGPDGAERVLRHPWSVIAYQIAGARGLAILNPDAPDRERDDPPADPTMRKVLVVPREDDLSTLVLLDEVLLWVRQKVAQDAVWKDRIGPFFQALTQAVAGTDRCALIVSLLASRIDAPTNAAPTAGDLAAIEVEDVFRRVGDRDVWPVGEGDVAEILRRRFFTPDSLADPQAYRPWVVAALTGIQALDEETRIHAQQEEARYQKAYPFHPDLLDTLYQKWTQLGSFQRTRGVLQTFAMALKDAEAWDESPLVGPQVFLSAPGPEPLELSASLGQLTPIASAQDASAMGQDRWRAILVGELGRARGVQADFPNIRHREVEASVVATFLHSQPTGKSGDLRQLLVFSGATRPDGVEIRNALRRYAEESWFLDERALGQIQTATDPHAVPLTWRLGPEANLTQIHGQALANLGDDVAIGSPVGSRIARAIADARLLREATGTGAAIHELPSVPSDVGDDATLRIVLLGLDGAGTSALPSSLAARYLTEYRNDRPRVKRNAVIVVMPSPEGARAVRTAVRRLMAWEDVSGDGSVTANASRERQELLAGYIRSARDAVPQQVTGAYTVAAAIGRNGQPMGLVIPAGPGGIFTRLKGIGALELLDQPSDFLKLLPGLGAWPDGVTTYPLTYLRDAFAERPGLPRFLRRTDLDETIRNGCEAGVYVIQARRPDQTVRTAWRERPDDVLMGDHGAEVVATSAASLTLLDTRLVSPGMADGAWGAGRGSVADLVGYFDGSHTFEFDGESFPVPSARPGVVHAAIAGAVRQGIACLSSTTAAYWMDELDPEFIGVMEASIVEAPPQRIAPALVLPDALPDAWRQDGVRTTASAATLHRALEAKAGRPLPWETVRMAIMDAIAVRVLTVDGGWPCGAEGADGATFVVAPPGRVVLDRPYAISRAFDDTFTVQGLGENFETLRQAVAAAGSNARVTVTLAVDIPDRNAVPPAVLDAIKGELDRIASGFSDETTY